jgi:peptide deformylase
VARRKLYLVGDPLLRQKAKKVPKIDGSIQNLIDDMLETMREEHGAGLAAPQIGVGLRIVTLSMEDGEAVAVINPSIVKCRDPQRVEEACLSVPGYWGELTRYNQAVIKALDRDGKEIRIKGSGRLAQALQHELDHLNGVLYVDLLEGPDDLHRED